LNAIPCQEDSKSSKLISIEALPSRVLYVVLESVFTQMGKGFTTRLGF